MSFDKKYIHLESLGKTEVEGITLGECYIFPKIDGTNGVIWFEDGEVKAGSRNRVLSTESDNQGFLNIFVKENYVGLRRFFEEFQDAIIYGEWLVPHTVKTYREEAWRRFYIFDVKYNDEFLPYPEYAERLISRGFDVIPPLVIIKDPTEDQLWKCVNDNTYLMKDGNFLGEGIVIKRYDYVNKHGRTTWAKLVRPEFKDNHRSVSSINKIENKDGVEASFIKACLKEEDILKEKSKIINESGSFENKDIPRFLNTAYYEFLRDNLVDFANKRNPVINFKELRARAFAEIRKFI